MTDHLPECPESDADWLANWWDSVPCICDRLRACEQRVFQEQIQGRQHDMVMAYLRGLDAAEIVVAELAKETFCDSAPCWGSERYIAAIRALKEKP